VVLRVTVTVTTEGPLGFTVGTTTRVVVGREIVVMRVVMITNVVEGPGPGLSEGRTVTRVGTTGLAVRVSVVRVTTGASVATEVATTGNVGNVAVTKALVGRLLVVGNGTSGIPVTKEMPVVGNEEEVSFVVGSVAAEVATAGAEEAAGSPLERS